ncbi:MAG TPA: peptidyl-prolyl cis-trans isomerase [Gammaproteobacteria bacterium]|nr:peptidyl-prolyl cis-trans isomerase [Gammaproteobacteria bacterium]
MSDSPSPESILRRLLREPTMHFFAIAIAIFAVYGISQSSNDKLLEIDQREIDARVFMQEMTRGEPLTEEQRQLITSLYVEEQILVREAMAMGLDNDARIHDMLAQKMRHVLSGNIIQPTAGELNDYYNANTARYQSLATVSVDELVFDSREALTDQLLSLLEAGAEAQQLLELEDGSQAPLPNVNSIDLANIFEPAFADTVFAAETGEWSGPFISNRGQHWLRITSRVEARLPALEEITDLVRLDWIAEEEEGRLQEQVDKLWDEYTIIITEAEQE